MAPPYANYASAGRHRSRRAGSDREVRCQKGVSLFKRDKAGLGDCDRLRANNRRGRSRLLLVEHPRAAAVSGTGLSRIVVESHRRWFGDQRLGTFTVSLDNARVGKLPPTGRLELQCAPGTHVLRLRQWWYRSPPTHVSAPEGSSVFLTADVAHRGHLVRALNTLVFAPWRALSVTANSRSSS